MSLSENPLRVQASRLTFSEDVPYDKIISLNNLGLYRAGHSFSPSGRTIGVATVLRLLLQEAGYEVLGQQAHILDYSAGAQAHESNVQNVLVFCKLFQPFLAQMGLATQGELDQLQEQMEQEMQEAWFCANDYYHTVWARKREV